MQIEYLPARIAPDLLCLETENFITPQMTNHIL